MRKWECGLQPVGAIRAYAPEGMGKVEVGSRNAEVGMVALRVKRAIGGD